MKTSIICPAIDGNGESATYQGGGATLVVTGTFDSGTVKLQVSYNGGVTWFDPVDDFGDAISFAANGAKAIWFGGNPLVRVNLAGSSGATVVAVEIHYSVANVRKAGLDLAM